jgi:L-fucose mutarotase/ribose pyranase (RbsD/FucU family)
MMTTTANQTDRITAREQRKRNAAAATFIHDASLERLIEEAAEGKHPVTPELRMRIGYYQRAKAAHCAVTTEKEQQ